MATITLTIPTAAMPRVIDALCDRGNYDQVVAQLPEQEWPTRGEFAKRQVIDWVATVTRNYEGERDAKAARAAAISKADSEVLIT